jgi:predicted RNase H-like HicB family nuclease
MAQKVLVRAQEAYNNMETPMWQIVSQHPEFPISVLEYNGLTLSFNKPYILTVSLRGGYLIHDNETLGLYAHGETFEELAENVFEYFYFLWHEYAQENDNKLDTRAKELKNALLNMAKEI